MQNTRKRRIDFSNKAKLVIAIMCVVACVISIIKVWNDSVSVKQVEEGMQVDELEHFYDITDVDKVIESEQAEYIDLNKKNTQTVITKGGAYVLFGETKYAVHIDVQDQIVHLILSGVNIRSTSGPALQISTAGKVVITLAENTENVLKDSGNYKEYTESDATLYSEADVTINGQGSLEVYGYYKDAIHTKEILKVLDGVVQVQSKRDGLRGNDGIVLMPKELIIESEGNGVRTTNARKEGKGIIEILAGEHIITAGKYAIVSESDLYVRDCQIECFSVIDDLDVKGKKYVQETCIESK